MKDRPRTLNSLFPLNITSPVMGQPLEAILEQDGRLRLLNLDAFNEELVGQSVTIRIIGIQGTDDESTELSSYTLLSQPTLEQLWKDEPDIDDVWGDL